MITEEQMQELEDRVVNGVMGKIGARLATVVGNLMSNIKLKDKLAKDFYAEHPKFDKHRDVVAQVVSTLEGKDLTKGYDKILVEAVPIIEQTILGKKELDFKSIQETPKKNIIMDFNGEL